MNILKMAMVAAIMLSVSFGAAAGNSKHDSRKAKKPHQHTLTCGHKPDKKVCKKNCDKPPVAVAEPATLALLGLGLAGLAVSRRKIKV